MSASAEIRLVTPLMARQFLNGNAGNRPVRPDVVQGMAQTMGACRWRITAEAVQRSRTGLLIDGQHRMQAVIRSGTPTLMLVVDGLTTWVVWHHDGIHHFNDDPCPTCYEWAADYPAAAWRFGVDDTRETSHG